MFFTLNTLIKLANTDNIISKYKYVYYMAFQMLAIICTLRISFYLVTLSCISFLYSKNQTSGIHRKLHASIAYRVLQRQRKE